MPSIPVISKDGHPLMPCHHYGRVKRWLKQGKAVIRSRWPFVVQLCYDVEMEPSEGSILGFDPGRTNIGLCAIDKQGRVLFSADCLTRNKDVPKLMGNRAAHRHASRSGERKARQRIEARLHPESKVTETWRKLPGCRKFVRCKVIRNTEARFSNRKRPAGWLTPTANQLLETHLNLARKLQRFLPIQSFAVEINRFDFARMENPGIRNWEYQRGRLAGYSTRNEAVDARQEGRCLLCGRPQIDEHHHAVWKSEDGSESIDNIAGLCAKCHEKVHDSVEMQAKLRAKLKGQTKKYGALSVLNQIMPKLLKKLSTILPTYVTTGYETAQTRREYGLPKSSGSSGHYVDAWCIAATQAGAVKGMPELDEPTTHVRQFRRHDRAIIKAQTERAYLLDGKVVAKNRHLRTGQVDPKKPADKQVYSLAEYRRQFPENIGRLEVRASSRRKNNRSRILPGAVFEYEGKQYVLRANQSNGTKFWGIGCQSYAPAKKCRIVLHNTGLVFG